MSFIQFNTSGHIVNEGIFEHGKWSLEAGETFKNKKAGLFRPALKTLQRKKLLLCKNHLFSHVEVLTVLANALDAVEIDTAGSH